MDFPEPTTLFDDYEGRGTAAREAEMRIRDHMGLTNDNKIKPSLAQEKGYEEFMDWYPGNYRFNLDRMNVTQRTAWDAAYDSVNDDFESRSEERRVGKGCRSRRGADELQKK